MLAVSNITKQFRGADAPIFKAVTFTVNAGERVGLIGPNGSGKSTLLRIITGEISADSGGVLFTPSDLRVGYLPQGLTVPDETPLREVLFPQAGELAITEEEVIRLAEAISTASNGAVDELMVAYSDALERLENLSHMVDSNDSTRILARMGLADVPLETPVGTLSGGQKTRLNLASLLLSNPQLLILDEPTNHLDVYVLAWLEDWLREFPGGVLIVSHDRTFLDNVVNRVVVLDPETASARVFVGDYSAYAETVRAEQAKQWAQWRDQVVEVERLKRDAQRTMTRAIRKENATNNDFQRRLAKKVAKRAKSKEKRLERYQESDERVEKPGQTWQVKMDFGDLERTWGDVVTLDNLTIGYDPANPLLANLDLTIQTGERIAVMGPNGQGKSTLLKTITGEVVALAGQVCIGKSAQVGYLAQEQEILDLACNPLDTLLSEVTFSETEARSFLHFFLFAGDEVFRPIAQLSYGERSRLMLALLVARGANLLVMDEPLNHLDLPSREKFEQAMQSYQGSVLAVVHDRYFVERFATTVWHIEAGTLRKEIRQVDIV